MSGKKLIIGSVVIAVALILAGRFLGGGSQTSSYSPHNGQANSGTVGDVSNISLPKLGGGTIALADYKGKKPVVVDFWATWCPNCRRDMPRLNSFYKKYKDQVEVIGINLQESEAVIKDFVSSRGISFPIALDPSGDASNIFGIRYTNTHILINKEGTVVQVIPGDIQESDIKSLI